MERPVVGLFSDPNPLALSIFENLLANFCRVVISTREKDQWLLNISHIKEGSHFSFGENEELDYAVFIDLSTKTDTETLLRKLSAKTKGAKVLLILSHSITSRESFSGILGRNVGIILVGDLFGPRMDLEGAGEIPRIIKGVLSGSTIRVPMKAALYPTFIGEAARIIVRWLFSFGPYGEVVFVSGRGLSVGEFVRLIKKVAPMANFTLTEESFGRSEIRVKKYFVATDLARRLRETFIWFTRYRLPRTRRELDIKKIAYKFSVVLVILFFLFPILSLVFSFGILALAKDTLFAGKLERGEILLSVGRQSAALAEKESGFFSELPLVGTIYGPLFYFSRTTREAEDIGIEIIRLGKTSLDLSTKILGKESYNPSFYVENIRLDLDRLYKKISFLQGEINSAGNFQKDVTLKALGNINLDQAKETALMGKEAAGELPEILGVGKKKVYLILLQNNMELRPTGGFIGSFALVSFEGGRLTEINVQDVYSADGQLKGHIEPPKPIKNYLGEGGWYLRDSNWDPDFPTTASKAEWFLDKEIDKSVDGAIGIDLELARALLYELGPVYLPDFNTQINHNNLYEKTQAEVETNFFPGSYKKSSFLTALTRTLLTKISKPQAQERLPLSKVILKSLEERHIQVFLHFKKTQGLISNLGWDGALPAPTCAGNCFPDWFGVVEANLGVNKANYFIKRKMDVSISLSEGKIKKTLSILYENNAKRQTGEKGRYKAYVRVLAPQVADFSENRPLPELLETSGRKEAGILIEVPPQTQKRFEFNWEENSKLSFSQKGEYRLLWRKQAGTDEDEISLKIYSPRGTIFKTQPQFFLTKDGAYGYNTLLSRDYISRIYW